jgi:hypothetical protein
MNLSVEQQFRLQKAASLGHTIFDALILTKVSAAEATELAKEPAVQDMYQQGRAEGAERVREKLMTAAMAGNVSAMKCLALHEAPDDDVDRRPQFTDGLTDQQRRAKWAAMVADLDRRFEFQRKLIEATYDELNPKHAHGQTRTRQATQGRTPR